MASVKMSQIVHAFFYSLSSLILFYALCTMIRVCSDSDADSCENTLYLSNCQVLIDFTRHRLTAKKRTSSLTVANNLQIHCRYFFEVSLSGSQIRYRVGNRIVAVSTRHSSQSASIILPTDGAGKILSREP